MTKQKLIHLAEIMGLLFQPHTNFADAMKRGTYVFDGVNGQRFVFELYWADDRIYQKLGESLKAVGRREKAVELHHALSITGPD